MEDTIQQYAGRVVVTDGAWGTQLQAQGLRAGACPDAWNVESPAAVEAVARRYVQAGSHVILTNTFRSNRFALDHWGLGDRAAEEIARGAQDLGEGESIAPLLSAVDGLKDFPVVAEMVATGEECDALDLLLRKAADFIDAQAAHVLHAAAPPGP